MVIPRTKAETAKNAVTHGKEFEVRRFTPSIL
jgi:hypothetical protein